MIDSQPKGQEANPPGEQPIPHINRRRFIVGGAALFGALLFDTTVSPLDLLGTQESRQHQGEKRARRDEMLAEGERIYTEAFFASNPTLLRPGDRNIAIINNPSLANIFDSVFHNSQLSEWIDGYNRFLGVSYRGLGKEFPTFLHSPPHITIKEYDKRPNFLVIAPDDSDLVGLPVSPETPSGLLAVFDGSENFAGDVTISMGNDRIDISNHGLGQHRVHLLAVEAS